VLGELLPTGAAVALCGGPLLLWMLRRLHVEAPRPASAESATPRRALRVPVLLLGGLLVAAIVISLCFSVTLHGWQWIDAQRCSDVWFWRVPRLTASLGAGVMVALAGTILQRVTGNPMASPDLLGVSGGAMLGMLVAAVVATEPSTPVLLAGAAAGALVCLLMIVTLGRRSGFAPEHVLLAGIAISAFSQAVIMLATASGGAYANLLRPLQYGSTYLTVPATAIAVGLCTVAAVLVAYLGARWLEILPLGANVADALGVGAQRARLLLLAVAAILTAGATVVIGPMSFVGLMAPHLARLLGFPRARSQMLVAALIGGLLMVLSDWLGRNMIFPQQMPAGVIATLLGGPYLMWLLRR
jgi:iron complex transport system permease protein